MRVALAVNPVTNDRDSNIAEIIRMTCEAAAAGAQLIAFGEMAVTGMVNNDNPDHDLPLAETIPGPVTQQLGALAKDLGIWLAIGLLEQEHRRLYDSAVLCSPHGKVAARYRRIDSGWHGRTADPSIYCQGADLTKVETEIGSFSFLICGDLWDDQLQQRVRELGPRWIIHPFARCFDDGAFGQKRWQQEEIPEYQRCVKVMGVPVLAVSYLSTPVMPEEAKAVGGAMAIGPDGAILGSHPIGTAGILYHDVDN